MRPRDFLTFHVESIIRSKGAKHLSPVPLSLYSILLLDAVVVILIPLVAIDAFIIYIFWKCCCKSKINKKEAPKTNKKKKQWKVFEWLKEILKEMYFLLSWFHMNQLVLPKWLSHKIKFYFQMKIPRPAQKVIYETNLHTYVHTYIHI